MKAYYILGQLVRPFITVLFYTHNQITHQPRARVMVWNEYNEILLIRNWSGSRRWGLPGGGVGRRENSLEAARRELHEEVGIMIPEHRFRLVTTLHTKGYPAPIYSVTIIKRQLPTSPHNPWEITHVDWFHSDILPRLSLHTREALDFIADES